MTMIRCETYLDIASREALLDAAMGPTRRQKPSEALRRNRLPAEGLALVAECLDGTLAGTVRLWPVLAGDTPALLLGPLAVDPAEAGAGIGSRLMRMAIAEAAWRGHGAILLVGDAAYYQRFGFSAEPAHGLAMAGDVDPARFLALELRPGALATARGMVMAAGRFDRRRAAARPTAPLTRVA